MRFDLLPAGKIEAILWDLFRVTTGVRHEPHVRALGQHDIIELELSADSRAAEDEDVNEESSSRETGRA